MMSDGRLGEFQTSYFTNVRNHGSIPMINWTSQRLGSGANQPDFQLRDIYEGRYDTYIRRWASDVSSRGMAAGSQLAAGTLLIPFIPLWPPAAAPTAGVVAAILALGLVCSGLAYLLYFRLITDIGATGALTVTYLIPVFGVLWGALFLGETVSIWMLACAALVILGTVFVLKN